MEVNFLLKQTTIGDLIRRYCQTQDNLTAYNAQILTDLLKVSYPVSWTS